MRIWVLQSCACVKSEEISVTILNDHMAATFLYCEIRLFVRQLNLKKSIVASPLMFVSFRMHQSLWMLRIHSARFNTWQRLKIAQCLQKVQSCHREYLNFRFVSQAKFKVEFAFAPIIYFRWIEALRVQQWIPDKILGWGNLLMKHEC